MVGREEGKAVGERRGETEPLAEEEVDKVDKEPVCEPVRGRETLEVPVSKLRGGVGMEVVSR